VVAIGGGFWKSLREFLVDTLLPEGTITTNELDMLSLAEDVTEAVEIIRRATIC
jgi:hypothetical protein